MIKSEDILIEALKALMDNWAFRHEFPCPKYKKHTDPCNCGTDAAYELAERALESYEAYKSSKPPQELVNRFQAAHLRIDKLTITNLMECVLYYKELSEARRLELSDTGEKQ